MNSNGIPTTLLVLALGTVLFTFAHEDPPQQGNGTGASATNDGGKDSATQEGAPAGSGTRGSDDSTDGETADDSTSANAGTSAGATGKDEGETGEASPPTEPAGVRTVAIESRELGGSGEAVVTAPLCSLFVDGDDYFVLAKGAESDIDFTQVEVELGETDGFRVEITEGLAAGDEVIAVSTDQLRFPAVAADFAAEREDGTCEFTGDDCGSRGQCIDRTGKTLSADRLFGAGPYGSAPRFGGGPGGYCPPH